MATHYVKILNWYLLNKIFSARIGDYCISLILWGQILNVANDQLIVENGDKALIWIGLWVDLMWNTFCHLKKSTRMVPNSNCNNEKRVYMDEENDFENKVRPCEDIDRDPTVAKVY